MRIACLALLALLACTYSLTPAPSRLSLELPPDPPPIALSLLDERTPADRALPFIEHDGPFLEEETPTDPPRFLAEQTQLELASRGLPVIVGVGDRGLPRLHLRTFRVRSYNEKWPNQNIMIGRVLLSADLETRNGLTRVAVFAAGASNPSPFANEELTTGAIVQPVSIAVKEFAAKLSNALYGYRVSDTDVDAMIAKLREGNVGRDRAGEVYALGFTNNPRAVDVVLVCTRHPGIEFRDAGIASLGTLRASRSLELLQGFNEHPDSDWRDRATALKSIGDLGTPEALAYLDAQLEKEKLTPTKLRGGSYVVQVVALYR